MLDNTLKIQPADHLQVSFLATAQETHADSLPEKLGNLPFQHIA